MSKVHGGRQLLFFGIYELQTIIWSADLGLHQILESLL